MDWRKEIDEKNGGGLGELVINWKKILNLEVASIFSLIITGKDIDDCL